MHYRWLITSAAAALAPAAQLAYAAEYLSVEAGQRAAFPEASAFEPVMVASEIKSAIARESGRVAVDPRVWRVRAGDRVVGWYVVDEVIGKVELITYAVSL